MQKRKINLLPPEVVKAQADRTLLIRLGKIQAIVVVFLFASLFALYTAHARVWDSVHDLEYELSVRDGAFAADEDLVGLRGVAYELWRVFGFEWLLSLEEVLPDGCEITRVVFDGMEVFVSGVGPAVTSGEDHRSNLAEYFESVRSGRLMQLADGRYSYEIWASPGVEQ